MPCTAARAGLLALAMMSASAAAGETVRIATFNVALNRAQAGALAAELAGEDSPQAAAIAGIVRRVRPDILLLNEFDHDAAGAALGSFRNRWLGREDGETAPIDYPFAWSAPVNTGVPSGLDLDRDGRADGPGDALGFGDFPGQYGMAVLSRFPIDREGIRTFRNLLWKYMPGALLPEDPETGESWYDAGALAVLPLSSKSHWDVPIRIGERRLHLLASHPTPPVFDGPEDRNGRRNHDEIRFWADYIAPDRAGYILDDAGRAGGLTAGERFVIAGDLNADPHDGDGMPGAVAQLLDHPAIDAARPPTSPGGAAQAALQGGVNATHRTPPAEDTSDFRDDGAFAAGNLRLDYVLPSKAGLRVRDAGVFWPEPDDPLFRLVGTFPIVSSDHRLVWIDIEIVE